MRPFNKNHSNPIKGFGSYQRKGQSARTCDISIDGRYVLAGFTDGELIAWKKFDENKILSKRGVEKIADAKIYTIVPFEIKDSQYILAGNVDSVLNIFKVDETGMELLKTLNVSPNLTSIYISKDGKYIVKGYDDGKVSLQAFNL